MNVCTRVFSVEDNYELALRKLISLGVPDRDINVLAPDLHGEGVGAAEAGDALFFVRGVGRVIASGDRAKALLQAAGAGRERSADALEREDAEFPLDSFFVLEHALRRGDRVLFVFAPEGHHREKIEAVLHECGGKDLHRAREEWWAEICGEERHAVATGDAPHDVGDYLFRLGFEVALHPSRRALTFEDAREELARAHPEACDTESFRSGYERGRAHQKVLDSSTVNAAL